MHEMQTTVTDVCNVCLSVFSSVCLSRGSINSISVCGGHLVQPLPNYCGLLFCLLLLSLFIELLSGSMQMAQDGEPCRVGVALIDLATGLYAVGAITTALLHRQTTNAGQHIQCNLLSTQVNSHCK